MRSDRCHQTRGSGLDARLLPLFGKHVWQARAADLGWQDFGVRQVDRAAHPEHYLAEFPAGQTLILQRYIDALVRAS